MRIGFCIHKKSRIWPNVLVAACWLSLALNQIPQSNAAKSEAQEEEANSQSSQINVAARHKRAHSIATQFAGRSSAQPQDSSTATGTRTELELEETSEHQHDSIPAEPNVVASNFSGQLVDKPTTAANSRLHIVGLIGPDAVQNGTQNVTLDCMFKFDKKLDQRLTIKWFFNDEVEPIYQWIPELNKRVYSDNYERFLDKSYQVSEDVDFMLQAYRWLISSSSSAGNQLQQTSSSNELNTDQPITGSLMQSITRQRELEESNDLEANRKVLANRLNKLAKLGGRHSSQLLDSLRAALDMEQLNWTRFRALRLIKPTSELAGRFTCSVSSLDGEDLRSTRLLVYEPAKNFTFTVSRISSQLYNLTCKAAQLFPRPTLSLFRYRAGPLEQQQQQQQQQQQSQAGNAPSANLKVQAHRPRLAATLLRLEPVPGTQTQLIVSARRNPQQLSVADHNNSTNNFLPLLTPQNNNDNEPKTPSLILDTVESNSIVNNQILPYINQQQQEPPIYEIQSWALVEDSSLSSNVVTQFECLLSIEGTNYEQRQSLALQRGWQVNSGALVMHSTLVGLFSALASLLCLMLALISSMLIFRLLRGQAKNRVNRGEKGSVSRNTNGGGDDEEEATNSSDCGTQSSANGGAILVDGGPTATSGGDRPGMAPILTNLLPAPASSATFAAARNASNRQQRAQQREFIGDSDGVYRIPTPADQRHHLPPLTFGTRYVVNGLGARQQQQQQQQYYNTRTLAQARPPDAGATCN